MAKSGYCSNDQILYLVLKRYKNQLDVILTPFMMYLEEYTKFLEERKLEYDIAPQLVMQMARYNWKLIAECDKERYFELADLANEQLI